MIIEAKTVKL